jgi:hypothetical protein
MGSKQGQKSRSMDDVTFGPTWARRGDRGGRTASDASRQGSGRSALPATPLATAACQHLGVGQSADQPPDRSLTIAAAHLYSATVLAERPARPFARTNDSTTSGAPESEIGFDLAWKLIKLGYSTEEAEEILRAVGVEWTASGAKAA